MGKKQTGNNLKIFLNFAAAVIYVTVFFFVLLVVKNQCHETAFQIESLKIDMVKLKDQVALTETEFQRLSRIDRIKRVAHQQFGYVDPVPESLRVVMKEVQE